MCLLLLRRQSLCFAVARIFVDCLTHPEAVRESIRRIFDPLSPSSSCPGAGAGAIVGSRMADGLLSLCAGADAPSF